SVSWEFAEVDTITTLDPNFDVAYHFGSLTVSFFRRDKLGGKLLLEKWVKQRPTLWRAHHMLGMHYFLELNDYKNAAPHVIRASQLPGAPAFITSLGIGLLSQSGAHLSALQSATELFEAAQDPEAKHRLAFRIRGLRWHLQKQALNDAIQSYRKTKGQLPDSLEAVQSFIKPSTDRNLSSLNQKEHRSEDLKNLMAENFFFRLKKDRSSVESTQPDLEKAFENMGVHVQKEIQK
ncbi:MAG: hypothetical protein EB120_12640, partial [Proteobacteria bacterium]|nr:hypothetical protein [Pseudomonadota bacterium]